MGDEVSKALNPSQQVVQIVQDELIGILGGEARKAHILQKPTDGFDARRSSGFG
jgi:signal recognition particle subunit SRP54